MGQHGPQARRARRRDPGKPTRRIDGLDVCTESLYPASKQVNAFFAYDVNRNGKTELTEDLTFGPLGARRRPSSRRIALVSSLASFGVSRGRCRMARASALPSRRGVNSSDGRSSWLSTRRIFSVA